MRKLSPKIIVATFILSLSLNSVILSGNKTFVKKTFISYTIEDGLPSNTVFSVIQDSLGFLWFGTQQGLCRFDGFEFKVYKTNPYNKNSLAFNNAGNLFYDSRGKIWIGTWGEGADCFDPGTETFTHYKNDPKDPTSIAGARIQAIYEDSFGSLWFCSATRGLSRLDPENREKGIFVNYSYDEANPHSISSKRIRGVAEDKAGNLWFASDNGFFRLKKENREKGIFDRFHLPKLFEELPSDIVFSIFVSREGKLYLGTDYGLFIFDEPEKLEGEIKPGDFTHRKFVRKNYALGYTTIFSIYEDHAERIWLGSRDGGLILLDYGRSGFMRFLPGLRKKNTLWSSHIRCLYEDKTQNLWIGTSDKGVARLDLKEHGFYTLQTLLPGKSFIVESDDHAIFVGGSKGVYKITFAPGKTRLQKVDLKSIALNFENFIFGFFADGNLYAFNPIHGFIKYNDKTGTVVRLKKLNNALHGKFYSLMHVAKSRTDTTVVWMLLKDGAIIRYNFRTGEIKNYIIIASKDYGELTTLYEEENGNVWFGTSNGLGFWERNEKVLQYELPIEITLYQHSDSLGKNQSLISNHILTIVKDNRNQLWIGTLNGITRIKFANGKMLYRNFNSRNGLGNNHIMSAIYDGGKKVWFATDYGLSALTLAANRFINYYESDGLPGNGFISNASCMTQDGKIIFATMNGLVYFYPDSVKRNKFAPKVAISEITFFNQNSGPITSISYKNELTLEHDNNTFILKIVALDYTNPAMNKYYYKLVGYQKRWKAPDYKNQITFVNIPPGEYELRFSGSNNNNVWGKSKSPLKITIKPAFWQTKWFRVLVAFIIIGLIFSWEHHKTKQIGILEKEIKEREKAEKKLKESEKKYRELIDNALDAIFVISGDGKITEINPGFTHLTGYTRDEALGRMFFEGVYKNDVEKARKEFKKALDNGSVHFDTRLRTKDNRIVWVSVLFNPVRDENGNLRYLHVIARNITELKRIEKKLINAKKKAEHAEKLKSTFLAQMSHEIRTPIYTIVNSIEVFKYYEQYDKDLINFSVSALEKAAERIFRTMDLVLRMADLQTGLYNPIFKTNNLVDSVRFVYSRYLTKAKAKGLELTFNTLTDSVNFPFDVDAIELILDNVINNAIKYTDNGSVTITVFEKNGNPAVKISDTGKGISEEELKIIFNPFIQAEQGYKRKYDGTGLGLTVSLEYCKFNNCKLEIEKNHPQGTTVILSFEQN